MYMYNSDVHVHLYYTTTLSKQTERTKAVINAFGNGKNFCIESATIGSVGTDTHHSTSQP